MAEGAGEPIELLELAEMPTLGVDAAITTRSGGISAPPYESCNLGLHVGDDDEAVIENRGRVAAAFSCTLDEMVFMDQIHGARVATVGPNEAGRGSRALVHALAATDGLVTTTPELVLVVQVADCAPLLLLDPVAGVLGVAHAGWRGTALGIGGALIASMEAVGAARDQMLATIGPCVSKAAYEVGEEVVEAILASAPGSMETSIDRSGERPHLDLALANAIALEAAGIDVHRIALPPIRTDDPRLFSDRAARPCGRFALLARLRRAAPVA